MHQQVPCTRKKMISFGSRLIACCELAPTLARQMWRHNYVIDRNEYLIFRLFESINPWVYSLQFLFKSTNNSSRYERKCEWVFFFWTQCRWLSCSIDVGSFSLQISRFVRSIQSVSDWNLLSLTRLNKCIFAETVCLTGWFAAQTLMSVTCYDVIWYKIHAVSKKRLFYEQANVCQQWWTNVD